MKKKIFFIGIMAFFTFAYYFNFFDLSKDIIRKPTNPKEFNTDLVPEGGVTAEIWKRYLFEYHIIPHWNPYIMAGQPLLSEPATNFISLKNTLLPFFRGQVAARLSIPLHLFLAWLGLLLFMFKIGFRGYQALWVGLIYLFNPSYMAFNAFSGHLNIVHGVSCIPWILYVAVCNFKRSWIRPICLAIILSLMIHSGANELFLYTCFFGFPLYYIFRGIYESEWKKSLIDLAVIIIIVSGLSLVKILPALDFISVSQRQFGMDPTIAFTRSYVDSFRMSGYCLQYSDGKNLKYMTVAHYWLVIPVLLFFIIGGIKLFKRNRVLLFVVCFIGFISILHTHSFVLFKLFWKIPIFYGQRTPDKSLFLIFIIIGTISAVGTTYLTQLLSSRCHKHVNIFIWVFLGAFAISLIFMPPPRPTMDDQIKRRENNPILTYVKQDPDYFRLTSYQDYDRHWGYQHQTVPVDIKLLMGYPRLWHNDMLFSHFTRSVGKPQFPFVPNLYNNYASMAGLMSVKYVMSTGPLNVTGLELVQRFPIYKPEPLPSKSRGPYLYTNTKYLPRVYSGTKTVLLFGSCDWVKETGLAILMYKEFAPDKITLIYGNAEQTDNSSELFDLVDYIAAENSSLVFQSYAGKLINEQQLMALNKEKPYSLQKIEFDELHPQQIRIPLNPQHRGQWIILSEKYSLYKGWKAVIQGRDGKENIPLVRCNHVNTAVRIPEGDYDELILKYKTPYFIYTSILMACTICLVSVVIRCDSIFVARSIASRRLF